jgi:hypothetical protein
MNKNMTNSQLILTGLAAVLLLLAAFAFYLLQDPSAPLPFIPATPTYTTTLQPTATVTPFSPTPTHRTTYTPFAATRTPEPATQSNPGATASQPNTTPRTPSPAMTATLPGPRPSATSRTTVSETPPTAVNTPIKSATATSTLSAGEVSVLGRIIQNATQMPNVVMTFADDAAPRQSITDPGGNYSFVTLAPGTNFTLTFDQADNPDLTPRTEIASLITIEGTLPMGVDPIDILDLEISINLNGIAFAPQSPTDRASFSASSINSSNPIMFIWSLYSLGGSYRVEVGPNGSDVPAWTSPLVAASSYTWDGTLDNGNHITQGSYWWRVSVTKSFGNYVEKVYTQRSGIVFTP